MLSVLYLTSNRLTLNLSKNWVPPFQLEAIGLANCELGPQFPKWIQTQKNLSHIDISNAGIHDAVPDWFWNLSPTIEYIDLSSNKLRGCRGQDFSQKFKLETLDLSNNSFSCPLPPLPPNTWSLNLSSNSFYGNISRICEILDVNNSLGYLDLSSNNFSGNIPNCWTNGENILFFLGLSNNNFSGSIPDSLGSLKYLLILSMRENDLSGIIPDTMKECQVLTVLDLSSNRFWVSIPYWIGEEMQSLKILILRENSFVGNIPRTLCQLKSLQLLDLSKIQLTGAIPPCAFAAMTTNESISDIEYETIKGSISMYQLQQQSMMRPPFYYSVLDLSSNFLTGEIPVEFTKLVQLLTLNLSGNQLVGSIPSDIGELKILEVLDLSRNQLSCGIPVGFENLGHLFYLNLSYNFLSGEIPFRIQLQSFDMSSFEGNPHLCGPPLTETCPTNISFEDMHCNEREGNRENENDDEDKRVMGVGISEFYISMGIGYFTAFWLFLVSLVFITSWRQAYLSSL